MILGAGTVLAQLAPQQTVRHQPTATSLQMELEEAEFFLRARRQEAADLRDENADLKAKLAKALAEQQANSDYWAAYVKGLSTSEISE